VVRDDQPRSRRHRLATRLELGNRNLLSDRQHLANDRLVHPLTPQGIRNLASTLFAYGTVSALALAALPLSFSRPFAVPTGVALIGLGLSLWRNERRQAETIDAPAPMLLAKPATR
jgi:hypothetical protein